MERVRIGVVGVGHLGRHHARLLAELDGVELAGVSDTREEARTEAATKHGVAAFADYRELIGHVDAVSVVVPTVLHREVAGFFLEQGVHVLVEKPIASTVAEAEELVELADRHGCVLQVGHIERFNPALDAIRELDGPRYIETQRLASFSFRSTDIGVVLDLMIHDLDLVLSILGDEVVDVQAFGGAVFTPAEDMASAILRFRNGAVAQLTASRVALKPIRRMRAFSKQGYASVDFTDGRGLVIRKNQGWDLQQLDVDSVDPGKIEDLWKYVFDGLLSVEQYEADKANPLADELRSFAQCVRSGESPVVSGRDGCRALAVAARVLDAIRAHSW